MDVPFPCLGARYQNLWEELHKALLKEKEQELQGHVDLLAEKEHEILAHEQNPLTLEKTIKSAIT